ncbi:S-adenosyl-L-methionine-dependent methyltransferase [Plectosphaerella cucumerina]|uniref:S-adenosyl-L-methionine-dependent methyltransferase n=1 Tax=Plectosphaerella cucumerina TaxID=40658 RepID=A0A8K0X9S0_9PEZI|nr:S-adenosyl-L-methionine-dependent methyltransferase [Plectosphaerella cucumerina]
MPELDKSPAAGETIVEGIRIAPTKKALSTNNLAIRHSPALYPTAWPENSPGQQEKDSLRLDSPLEQGYMFPIDYHEQARLDHLHSVIRSFRGHLLDVKLPKKPRVLDLGTGTGIWAIQVSDMLWKSLEDHALVHGLDMSLMQPQLIPYSVSFTQGDIEGSWPLQHGYDLIHIQSMLGAVRHWKGVYEKAFSFLQDDGHLQHIEIEWKFFAENGSPMRESALTTWSDSLHRAMRKAGLPLDIDRRTTSLLEAVGFADVTESVIQLPVNPWDNQDIKTGLGWNKAITDAVEAMSKVPLTRIEGQPTEEVLQLVKEVRQQVCNLSMHAYCKL